MSGFSAGRSGGGAPTVSTLLAGSAVVMGSGTPGDIISLALAAGDWDLYGNIDVVANGADVTQILGWMSIASATLPTVPNAGSFLGLNYPAASHVGLNDHFPVGRQRLLLASPATVYLTARMTFTGGPPSVYGFFGAFPR